MDVENHNRRKEIERSLLGSAVRVLVARVRRRPLARLRPLARRLAWVIRTCAPSRQKLARANMALTLNGRYAPGDYPRLAAAATYNMALTWLELLKLPTLSREEILAAVRLERLELLQETLALGRGCLLLTAHFGPWELGGAALAAAGIPLSVIGSYSSQGALLVNEAREALGIQVIEADDLRGMLRALRSGRCLAILPDLSHVARSSLVVDFMGRPALTAVGMALMAQRCGCLVVPAFSYRETEGCCRVQVYEPLELSCTDSSDADLRANTELFNHVIGEQIVARPEQWLWLHNRWKVYEEFMGTAAG